MGIHVVFRTARDESHFILKSVFLRVAPKSILSEVLFKPLAPVRLLPCDNGSVCNFGMLPSLPNILLCLHLSECSLVHMHSLPKPQMTVIAGELFLAVSPWFFY